MPRRFLPSLFVCALWAGCAVGGAVAPQDFSVVVTESGGFTGVETGVEVTRDGEVRDWAGLTVEPGAPLRGRLSESERLALWTQVRESFRATSAPPTSSMVRTIRVWARGREQEARWAPGTDAELDALYGSLQATIREADEVVAEVPAVAPLPSPPPIPSPPAPPRSSGVLAEPIVALMVADLLELAGRSVQHLLDDRGEPRWSHERNGDTEHYYEGGVTTLSAVADGDGVVRTLTMQRLTADADASIAEALPVLKQRLGPTDPSATKAYVWSRDGVTTTVEKEDDGIVRITVQS